MKTFEEYIFESRRRELPIEIVENIKKIADYIFNKFLITKLYQKVEGEYAIFDNVSLHNGETIKFAYKNQPSGFYYGGHKDDIIIINLGKIDNINIDNINAEELNQIKKDQLLQVLDHEFIHKFSKIDSLYSKKLNRLSKIGYEKLSNPDRDRYDRLYSSQKEELEAVVFEITQFIKRVYLYNPEIKKEIIDWIKNENQVNDKKLKTPLSLKNWESEFTNIKSYDKKLYYKMLEKIYFFIEEQLS